MPLDAICLAALTKELRGRIIGMKIDKVQQPERDLLLLSLRGNGETVKLLVSANVGSARVHITTESFEQPAQPPMFCMLLRKHLLGARITELCQPDFERMLRFDLDAIDELGTTVPKTLYAELMGRNSNIILADAEGRVIDCLRRVDAEMSPRRPVLPGLIYRLPPKQEKPGFFELPASERKDMWARAPKDAAADKWLLDSFSGLSPLLCRELCARAFGDASPRIALLSEPERLLPEMDALAETVETGDFTPCMLSENGRPREFSFLPILQYGGAMETERFGSFSELLEAFYGRRDRAERMKRRAQDLTKTVKTARDRAARKLATQRQDYEKTLSREEFRKRGDLITANLWRLKKGDRVLRCEDFYQEGSPTVEIGLDPLKTPQQNAAKCYREYNRLKTAQIHLSEWIERGERELDYLESVLEELSRAEGEKELAEIRRELTETGYLRAQKNAKGAKSAPEPKPLRCRSTAGLTILVGRNNTQNDRLTLREARKTDLWLHAQKIHGAHVILCCEGREPDERSVYEAACLAAWHSQGRESGKVPVDYALVRYVKKPNGALPGMVIYTDYRTVTVSPTEAEISALEKK